MKNDKFVLVGVFYDKSVFEKVRDILTDAGIEFWASNKAPSVNFKVPGSAYTEIELHVVESDVEKVEALLTEHGAEEWNS